MTRLGKIRTIAGLLLVGTAAAACGQAAATGGAATAASPTTVAAAATSAGTVRAATESSLGTVLVDSAGRTLYMFTPDQQRRVTCTPANGCAQAWPPLDTAAGAPVAGAGARTSLLGTIDVDGHTQVTYNHWPLYTFAGDAAAHQAHGQGLNSFGGSWFVLTASGQVVRAATPSTPGQAAGY